MMLIIIYDSDKDDDDCGHFLEAVDYKIDIT